MLIAEQVKRFTPNLHQVNKLRNCVYFDYFESQNNSLLPFKVQKNSVQIEIMIYRVTPSKEEMESYGYQAPLLPEKLSPKDPLQFVEEVKKRVD